MGTREASLALLLLALTVAPFALASPAALESHVVTIPPTVDPVGGQFGTRGGYAGGVVVADIAGTLTLTNLDITAHDMISDALGPADNPWCSRYIGHHFCPLFASPLVGLGGQTTVEGLDQLTPGTTYSFFCSVHHWMTGTLVAI